MTKRQRWALVAVILSSSVVFLDGTVVNLALPHIAAQFHAGFSQLQWVVESYLLSLSALILVGGALGDLYGRKRMYLLGLVGFGVASLLCAAAPSLAALVIMRLVQGVCGALLIPGALAIIETNFGASQRGAAFGRWTAWTSAALVIGPLLGGYLIDAWSWRWIFFINLPLVALSLVLGLVHIEESRERRPPRLDVRGVVLAALALAGIIYGLVEGPVQHWSVWTLAALAAGLVLAAVFVWYQRHVTDPMVDLALFRSRMFTGANLMTFAMYGALGGFMFAFVIYLQTTLGWSSLAAGFSTLPVTVLLLTLSSRAGAWATRHGPRGPMTVGPLLVGAGMAWLGLLHRGSDYVTGVLPGVVLFGLGMALLVAPLTTTVMGSVDEDHVGIASAINNAVSRVSGLLIVALLGLLGAAQVYPFTVVLSVSLAIAAAIISWTMIRAYSKI